MPINAPASGVRAGTVAYFAASTPPAGWLACNGAAVSRSLYAALFNAIGTTYGAGDGSTTFNVPDLRGEFIRGWDNGRGVDSGRSIGTAQAHQMQSHTHGVPTWGGDGTQTVLSGISAIISLSAVNTGAAGGTSNGGENRPRNVAMLACIKF